jgi:predicted phage terminase large subunit-like protein
LNKPKRKKNEVRAAVQSVQSLYIFLRNFWGVINEDKFEDNFHIREICDKLETYAWAIRDRRPIPDLIINIPPGSSKSTMVSQMFPIWLWLHAPWAVVISSGYSETISVEHSNKSKLIYKSEKFQSWYQSYFKKRFGKEIALIKDQDKQWENNFNGRRYNTSTNGTVTGVHGHIIIRDDPITPEQARSAVAIARANRFNDETLSTRKKDKRITPTVTVMQRLHNIDATGWDLKKEKLNIDHICLPAKLSKHVKPERLKEKYVDGLLDAKRMTEEVLEMEKSRLGSYGFAGQFQQRPTPEGGHKVKEEWFVKISPKEVPGNITWNLWIDGAYTDKTANDPTGLMIAGYYQRENALIIKHAVSKRMGLPELLAFIPEYFALHGLSNKSRAYFEPKASGHSIAQMLRKNTKLSPIQIKGPLVREGKEARLQVASPKIEAGKFWIIDGPWNDAFMSQLTQFPAHEEDEFVDLSGYACHRHFTIRRSNRKGARRRN